MTRAQSIRLGATLGFLGVALGAFGAHGLKATIEANGGLDWWQTASQYHLIHAVAALLPAARSNSKLSPNLAFAFGILIFSGSLYVMALTGTTKLGMITPIGGLFFLIGWFKVFTNASDSPVESPDVEISQTQA